MFPPTPVNTRCRTEFCNIGLSIRPDEKTCSSGVFFTGWKSGTDRNGGHHGLSIYGVCMRSADRQSAQVPLGRSREDWDARGALGGCDVCDEHDCQRQHVTGLGVFPRRAADTHIQALRAAQRWHHLIHVRNSPCWLRFIHCSRSSLP